MKNQKLTDITRGLQHAAQTTLSMLAEQYIRTLDQFFRPDRETGIFEAKTIRVKIDEKNFVNVPLISLVNPKGLALEKMHVQMSVRLEEAGTKSATGRFDSSRVTRTSFKVSVAPRGIQGERRKTDVIDMELDYKSGEPPEALMRISDLYANTITPVQRPEKDEDLEAWYPEYRNQKWFENYVNDYEDRQKKKALDEPEKEDQ